MRFGPSFRAVIAALALLIQFGLAQAFDNSALLASEREANVMRSDLERVQSVLEQAGVTDDQLAVQRDIIEKLRVDSVSEALKLAAPLDDVEQQLNQLGAPPAVGTKETPTIAAQRIELTDAVARIAAAKKQYELIGIEADQMSAKVSASQRNQFFQRIFKADKSILNPLLWRDAFVGVGILFGRLSSLLTIWWHSQAPVAQWAGLLLLPAVLGGIWSGWRIIKRNFSSWLPLPAVNEALSPLRRLWRVISGAVLLTFAIGVLNLLIAASLDVSNLATPRFDIIVGAITAVMSYCLFNFGFAQLICAPRQPEARLIAIDDRAAKIVPVFVLIATLVQATAAQIAFISGELLLPVSLIAGQSAIAAAILIALAGLMLVLLRRQSKITPSNVPEPHYLAWFVRFIPLLWVLLIVAVFALIFGYLALAYFISGKILDTVLVVIILVLAHHLVDALSDTLQNPVSALGQQFRKFTNLSDRGLSRLSLTFRTLADILLVIVGIPWLLALWTVTWVDFRSLSNNALVGFRVGSITVSPLNIISLFLILALGVVITRFITSWLDKRVLTQTKMNKGVQDSVRTGANYAGYVLAAAFALSAAGFDFSSFTIVAGALGVGIGFGLQSIVNNFVSGLILLAERPVRVGDWVVTGAGEGIVKKINVRSTEIETFDNCTIIVPNSNLITEAVRNWTHRDTLGRFLVTVGVVHGTDADQVAKILTEVVGAHPKILRYPPALVQLSKFAPNAMEFEVRGHVADVFDAAQVSSDLRFSIARRFLAEQIIIPAIVEKVFVK
jgi:potassium-dependent mechanosensitive channel